MLPLYALSQVFAKHFKVIFEKLQECIKFSTIVWDKFYYESPSSGNVYNTIDS